MKNIEKVIIVGAGVAGKMVKNEILAHKKLNYKFIGFVDDTKKGKTVLGTCKEIPEIVNKFDVDLVIIAIPSGTGEQIRNIFSYLSKTKVKTKIVPGIFEIISGDVKFKQLRNIKPDDLLGRESIDLSIEKFKKNFKKTRVIITGAAGSIGSELTKKILSLNPDLVIGFDQNESELFYLDEWVKENKIKNFVAVIGNVLDENKLNYVMNKYKLDTVIHAAAYKHVPLMENYPEEAVKTNVKGTLTTIETAIKNKIKKFILISSDKAVNPVNVMGATKRICELILTSKSKKHPEIIFNSIRFGNVLSSRGSVIPTFLMQINKGGPVTVTHRDILRYFMTINEAAQLIIQCICIGKKGEIFVLDMGEPIKILDLAQNLINLYAPEKNIKIVFTGLRPGEKLFEEYLTSEDRVNTTKFKKIFIAKQQNKINNNFEKELESLFQKADKFDTKEIYSALCKLDKSFKPKAK
jgi:FlaA1/EpsC-like NDP-sugar epimerase